MYLQLTLAARYLWGRKLRTALTTVAVMFGVLVIFSMNILLPTMLEAFQANLLAASGQVDVTISEKSGEAFPARVLNQVRAVDGVRAAAGSLSRTVNLPAGWFGRGSQVGAVALVGIDPRAAQTVRNYALEQGRFLRSDDERAAVITTSLADQAGLTLGDELRLPTTEGTVALRVVGLRPARTLPGNEEVLVTLFEAQKLLDLPGRINTIEANLDTTDTARRDAIQAALEARLGPDYALGALSSGAELFAGIQLAQAFFNLLGFLALFMGGFIIFNTFRTVVAERRHDIGMLRAVGASRRTIVGLILAEGLLQGVLGTLAGMGLGYVMGVGIVALTSSIYEQYLHVTLGAPVVSPVLVVITLVLGIGVTLLAGLLPAVTAGRVTPLEALRPTLADAYQRTARVGAVVGAIFIVLAALGLVSGSEGLIALGGLLFLLGLVLVAPALIKPIAATAGALVALTFARQGTGALAQGNLARQPARAAVTASATMIGLAIIVAVGGLIASLSGSVLDVVRKSLGSDYLFIPPSVGVWENNVGAKAGLADELRAVRGVGVVSTIRFAKTEGNGQTISLLGIDPQTFQQVSGLNFEAGDARTAFADLAGERALIVNRPFATAAGLEVGDLVRLSTPAGERTYRVAAIAGDFLNAKITTAYVSQANLRQDFHKTEDVFIQLNLAPGADPAAVEPKLRAIVARYPQFTLISGRAYLDQTIQLFQAAWGMMYLLFIALALPSLIAMLNTLAIGVLERTREIGMLRAIGATRKQVSRVVLAEALLLAAAGTGFGLLAGLYLGYVIVSTMSVGIMKATYSISAAGLLAAVAIGLLFGVAAALLPARQAAQMEIVKALRYE